MKINQNNPNIQLQNTLGIEQAARKAAQEKSAESAKAHEAEEALRLQEIGESLKEIRDGRKKNPGDAPQQGRRNARYRPDGTVEPEGLDHPEDGPPPPQAGRIDLKA
jgi:hypothetical protein